MVHNFWMLLKLDFYALWWWYHPYKNVSIVAITNIRLYWFCVIDNFISYIIICIWSLAMFQFLATNLKSFASHLTNSILFDISLYYSVAFNESKEKLRKTFGCFSAIKYNFAPLSFSNFPVTLTLLRNSRICLSW